VLVWFLRDGEESILIYSRPRTPKLRNLERNPKVSLYLDGDRQGGDIVVCLGKAHVSSDPPADQGPEYVAKYTWGFERNDCRIHGH
jgi:PPOX class probable F420-dependent enzyme